MSTFPRVETHLPSSEHESFTRQSKSLEDELHLHKTEQKISVFSRRKMTVPSKVYSPYLSGCRSQRCFLKLHVWKRMLGKVMVQAFYRATHKCLHPPCHVPPSPTHLLSHPHPSLCVLSTPTKGSCGILSTSDFTEHFHLRLTSELFCSGWLL